MNLGHAVSLIADRVVDPIQGMHHAISRRWFKAIGPFARPVHLAHDAIAKAVYGSIRVGASTVGHGLAARADADSPAADRVHAVANGLWGDDLGEHEEHVAIPMTLHFPKAAAPALAAHTMTSAPTPGRIVVLVHGLFETERTWQGTSADPGLVERLADEPSIATVSIRYNSGLPVSTNGARLASLLDTEFAGWPVPLDSIILVGHSMGGLVIRSACSIAQTEDQGWLDAVTDVVTLGAPHRGSPIEKLVNTATWGLTFASTDRVRLLHSSVHEAPGIKDTRFGGIGQPEPADLDALFPDALASKAMSPDDPETSDLPAGINHHFIAGSVTSNPTHPIGRVLGDLVVRPSSATDQSLKPTTAITLGGLNHQQLSSDPTVIDHVMEILREWSPTGS